MEIPLDIDPDALMRGLNSLLPATISFLKIECCSPSFHPIRDAGKKEYHYLFSSQSQLSPFWVDLIAHYPHALDLSKMQAAAALFIGQHDFANFYCTGSETPTTERTIYLSEITNVSSLDVGGVVIPEHYLFKVAGNGFLKQMVRLLIGAIWEVGRGRVSLEELAHAISLQTEGKIGVVAPPQGLYLKSIGG
ncbi:MAG: hypothetical protein HN623_12380 [Bdellovibrionales bacterium]|nr:hypothetical protein [Bdellovibrionales bacterium]